MNGVYYMKDKYGRKDFYVLRRNWGESVEWGFGESVPDGSYPMEIVGEREGATGYHIVFDEGRKTYVREYIVIAEDDPRLRLPRKFSKLSIYCAITKLGAWDKIEKWLGEKTVEGINGWKAFQLAQEISEAHPMFGALAKEAQSVVGLTDEQFEMLLDSCVLAE